MRRKSVRWMPIFLMMLAGMPVAKSLAAQCQAGATALCLNGGRFEVTASWRTPNGITGTGRAVPLTTDTGYFWFFDPASAEVMVKVINGCAVNQRFWVFAGGLTNVEVTLRVESHIPGQRVQVKTFVNPQGTPFRPIQSTDAFSTCGRGGRG